MSTSGFSKAERDAMKARAEELKEGKGGNKRGREAQACLDAIAEMADADRVLAERIHAIVSEKAPDLLPKTWYGMPAYADENGKAVVFFKSSAKFGERYSTLGFNDSAQLDDGTMWAKEFAVTALGKAEVARIEELVSKAVS